MHKHISIQMQWETYARHVRYIMQVHKYTHTFTVCLFFWSRYHVGPVISLLFCADLQCWMYVYMRAFPLTSQNMLNFCNAFFFKHVDLHLHLHRVILHWVQSEVFEVPSPQKVQATMLSLDRIMLPVLAKGKMKNSEPELQIWGKNGEWVHAVCSWGTKILENGGWKKHH